MKGFTTIAIRGDPENKITLLSGGVGAIAVASGMAAISNIVMTVCSSGDNIITSKYLFGNTYSPSSILIFL